MREDTARVEHQQLQQLVLGPGQLDERAVDGHAVPRRIEPQLGKREAALEVTLAARAAKQRADPRVKLVDVERLGEVVVGARIEPVDPVRDGIARGQHQDRKAVALAAEQAADLEPVDVGQPDVEHHRIGHGARDLRESVRAAPGEPDLIAR